MLLPSKIVSYNQSVLAQFPLFLRIIKEGDISPRHLYKKVEKHVTDVAEFEEILDCLYVLGKIDLIEDQGVLRYVD